METVGLTVGVAVLITAVVAVLMAHSPTLSTQVTRAFCLVFSLGQGDCGGGPSVEAHRPPQPCVVFSKGHEARVEGSAAFTLGAGEQWQVDHLSDDTYQVTRGLNAKAGLDGGYGFTVTATVNDNRFGAASNASGAVGVRVGAGQVYHVADDTAVKKLLAEHERDVVKAATFGPMGPSRWLADRAESALELDDPLPEPESQWYEGTLEVNGDASITYAVISASASAGASGSLGYRKHRDGSTTQYVRAVVSGSTQATVLGSSDSGTGYDMWKAKAEGRGQVVVEIERGADGAVTGVRTRGVLDGEALASTDAVAEGADPQASGYVEHTVDLPVRTTADAAVAQRYLGALGMYQVAGFNLPPSSPAMQASGSELVEAPLAYLEAAEARGYVTEQSFRHNSNSNGFTLDAEWIAKVGGDINYSTNERHTTGGRYWDGTRMVPWAGCAA